MPNLTQRMNSLIGQASDIGSTLVGETGKDINNTIIKPVGRFIGGIRAPKIPNLDPLSGLKSSLKKQNKQVEDVYKLTQ